MRCEIDLNSLHPDEITIPTLRTKIIGYFSIDGYSRYRADLSQVKYYIPFLRMGLKNVNFDVNINFESIYHRPISNLIQLDNILKWISNNFNRLENPLSAQAERWLDVDFVCPLETLKIIFSGEHSGERIIYAYKCSGTIYLHAYQSTNDLRRYRQDALQLAKFKQYMVSSHPSYRPNPTLPLNEYEEFHCMFKAKFDNYSLLYEAKVDGIFSQQPITDTLIIGNTFELIDLKTFPMLQSNTYIGPCRLRNYEAMAWWSHNYLMGINRVICGLRDETNRVRMIKEYTTDDLPKFSERICYVNRSKVFCKMFLDNVKRIVTKDENECRYKINFWESNESKKIVIHFSEIPNKT